MTPPPRLRRPQPPPPVRLAPAAGRARPVQHARPAQGGLPRLLRGLDAGGGPVDHDQHLALWGPMRRPSLPSFLPALEESGLRGHGGGWFPVGAKWKSVAGSRRAPVVVVNGAESEPLSGKDALLLGRLPHLVLDGAAVAAEVLGAARVVVYAHQRQASVLRAAIERRRVLGLDRLAPEVVAAPDVFLAGQESAAINVVNGGPPLPRFVALSPIWRRGVDGGPTLVQNAETLAHVALLARFGPRWFRQLGAPEAPGTLLLTVTAADRRSPQPRLSRRVVEAALGTPLAQVVARQAGDGGLATLSGVLLGGFGGTWLDPASAEGLTLTEPAAQAIGASLGAGVVALLPRGCCPLAETARVVRYLESQGAGQCGPCIHGLAGLAEETERLAFGPGPAGGSARRIGELCDLVEGRGACRHPDGATHLARSALYAFAEEVRHHERRGPCREAYAPPFLPVVAPSSLPKAGGW